MTDIYHGWLRANYKLHIWPEDSLSYGLGIPYLAFAGTIACWNDLISSPFRDGLGFVSVVDLQACARPYFQRVMLHVTMISPRWWQVNKLNISQYLDSAIAIHWSGRNKPWGSGRVIEEEFQRPWDAMVTKLNLSDLIIPQPKVNRSKAIFFTEARSGSEWFMDLLDHHPQICATGDRNNPTAGFGREALLPEHYSGSGCGFRFPTCSVRLGWCALR